MARVALAAAAMSRFGNRPMDTPRALFAEAWDRLRDRMPEWDGRADEAWIGTVGFAGHQPGNSSALFLQKTASQGIPARRVENACASSAFALRDAWHAIRTGQVQTALVAGVESMSPFDRAHRGSWLGVSGDTEVERASGLTFPGVYAMMARAHMEEHGTTREQLAHVAVKNHRHGADNPDAQFQKHVSLEKALGAPTVADPLGLFDCCSTTDGAAALLLASEEWVQQHASKEAVVWLRGSGAATDTLALHDRDSLTSMAASKRAGREALDQAGWTPRDVDFAEVHDCFTIAEIMATEDLGFVQVGNGGAAAAEGRTDHGGDVVVNPSGGLKAKGHPLGASGAAQAVEVWEQFTGHAGKRTVQHARRAITHSVGGSGATCAVHAWEAP